MVSGAFVSTFLLSINPFRKSVYRKNSLEGHGWEVVEKYILGQKGYDKIEAVQGVGEGEKAKTHKT